MKRMSLLLLSLGLLAGGCSPKENAEAPSSPPGGPPPGTATTSATIPVTKVDKPAANGAKKAGGAGKVIKLASGLKYVDLVVGKGESPKPGQTAVVQYTGTLENGKKFDSSYDHGGDPFKFPLGQGKVIPGWDEGVATMKPGGKRKLIVPPDLGYGPTGTPDGTIPPNATLIFEIELLRVE